MQNPFRNREFRKQFDMLVHCYRENHRDLVRLPWPHCGNGLASSFWRGYFGDIKRERWDASSRQSFAYAAFRAGEAVRKSEGDAPRFTGRAPERHPRTTETQL
jgi:hypothetical protein